jgi:hypothetical protein
MVPQRELLSTTRSSWNGRQDTTESQVMNLNISAWCVLSPKTLPLPEPYRRKLCLAIWHWKGAMRAIRFVHLDEYEEHYAAAIRQAATASPEQRMDVLIGNG